jgi:hypothetical protein
MIDINFYSLCFPNKQPKMTLPNQTNLMLGSAIHKYYDSSYTHDDTNDNISHLNNWFGQTTGLYWVWKNVNKDHVGICTYRLFWNEEELKKLSVDENTIIVPKSININTAVPYNETGDYNIVSHYIHCHGDLPMCFLYYLAGINNISITTNMIDDLKHQTELNPFNMFIANKKIYDKICELLFDTLFKLHEHFSYLFEAYEKKTGQKRILDFLAERILHIIYTNIDHFIPGVKVYECEVINLPH